jgi:aminoglycoside phosphotransferase (APT) family kinase protein
LHSIDTAGQVRPGEELPVVALERYLTRHIPGLQGRLTVRQFPGGYSNLTYLLRVGGRELVLRRPPVGVQIAAAHDMSREYRVLAGLSRVYTKAPQPLLYCEDMSIIGATFYVMERLQGVVLRSETVHNQHVTPEEMAGLAVATIDNLAVIHGLDVAAAGFESLGRPAGYVERQIRGWTQRYRAAQTHELPGLERAIDWLAANLPPESGAAILHNDYKYDNLILDPADLTEVRAVLDWEMCTIGDPLMDLGTTLGYWTEAGDPPAVVEMFGLTTLPGNLNRAEVVARYGASSGRSIQDPLFYYVYGLFKIAVIVQQLYKRFIAGNTHDPRYAHLGDVVGGYDWLAERALATGHISSLGEG